MEAIVKINDTINSLVWGPPMLVLIVGTGIFLTLATKVFQISQIKVWWKGTFGELLKKKEKVDDSNISPFQAVTTALASTVGTGNIVGVATAVYAGGPGAVFWMWVSGFVGMMTKYCEVVLAVKYRETDEKGAHHGGPMYYIQNGLKMKWLAVIFALFGTFATFGIGNMTQANAIASSLNQVFNVPNVITGIAIALIVALVIIGGIKRIASVTEKLVPFMCVLYVIGSVIILVLNAGRLGHSFGLIFGNAFSMRSVGGGLLGYLIMRGMRYGIARGVFSNEAGLGSAPIAHAASRAKDPVQQGLWGVFEVFMDTIVICTLSGLVIVTADINGYLSGGSELYRGTLRGVPLVMESFSQTFGPLGGVFIAVGILCFAGSTILGWSYYGQQCLGYLTKNNKAWDLAYKVIFALVAIIGATGGLTLVWDIADTLNGLMAIPNLIGVLLLSKVVFELTKEYLARQK
jgi:AGCS family alanine or glycine:cation symporter